ncbi:MAG: DUF4224 domain-containing protein [Steroidobacteraceae bacterium]
MGQHRSADIIEPLVFATLPLCLTAQELTELTGKMRASAQRRVLRHMAIEHRQRPDGSVVVLRSAIHGASAVSPATERTEPNWS